MHRTRRYVDGMFIAPEGDGCFPAINPAIEETVPEVAAITANAGTGTSMRRNEQRWDA